MNIFILGAGVMQIPAIKKAKEMGLFVLCADGNSNAIGKNLCDIFYPVDIKDKSSLLEIAKKFHDKHILNGVFTVGTDFSSSVAWLTQNLELPGIPYQVALNATDKSRMRNCFKNNNVSSPLFVEFSSEMNIEEAISDLQFPLVVKPVDSMGSRGVKRINNLNELKKDISESIKFSRTSRAIIEEYIDGPEFSLDALVIDGEVHVFGFADREILFPPYFVEMGHDIPTKIDFEIMEEIIKVFSDGIKALGITYGSAKGDLKLSSKGPVIGEIAARLSGGYMSGWTFPYSSDIDLIKGGIELSLGLPLSILNNENSGNFSSERAFISIPGVVSQVIKPNKLDNSIKDIFYNIKKGSKVKFPKNNVEKCGNIISKSNTKETAIEQAEKTAAEIIIRLETNNYETQQFLFHDNDNLYPPKAFNFESTLYNHLDESLEKEGDVFIIQKIDKILKSRKKDWQKRTVSQVLKLLSKFHKVEFSDNVDCGKEFYQALTNGSIQGVLYYLDSLES